MSYADYLKDKRVVIVGPAPSIINSGQGNLIDSYDIVVRINKAVPVPINLHKDIGSRTDILYNCLKQTADCGGIINMNILHNNGVKCLICPYPPIFPFKKDIEKFVLQNENFNKKHNKLMPFRHIDTKYYKILEYQMKSRPNSGICAILDLLSFDIKELYITGFTFFKGGYYKQYRPLNEKQVLDRMKKAGNHNQLEQKRYMKSILLNDNRVKMDQALLNVLKDIN